MDLPVDITAQGVTQRVTLRDLSRTGMFLEMTAPFPNGTEIQIAMQNEGRRLYTLANVTHSLPEAEARSLGRVAGVGIAFQSAVTPMDHLFQLAIERIMRERRTTARPLGLHVVIADRSVRVLERMSTALDEAGCTVAIATTGMEVLAACLRRLPDVVLVERDLPVMNGLRVIEELAADPALAMIPVIVTSENPSDIVAAFEAGAMDFIAKPFTAVEVVARARRLPIAEPVTTDRVVLRGSLSELALPGLLTMLEQERKTGRIVLFGAQTAWIDVIDGRIAGAGCSGVSAPTRAVMMSLLDWTHGTFELLVTVPDHADDAVVYPITHLLLEHARIRDEQRNSILSRIDSQRARASA
jgi:twitching motility two-component system response regulator PilH